VTEPRPPVEVLPTWLPDPERPGGDWIQYIEDLYAQYTADFLTNRTVWRAKPVFVDRDPQYNGKDVGFWHLISGIDRVTKDLLDPEPDRCARLCWVRPVLEAHPDDVRTWIQERNGFIAIALPDFSFRVILKERDRVVYLKSAYFVERPSRRSQFRAEYDRSEKR